jgi:hypothetical protein
MEGLSIVIAVAKLVEYLVQEAQLTISLLLGSKGTVPSGESTLNKGDRAGHNLHQRLADRRLW